MSSQIARMKEGIQEAIGSTNDNVIPPLTIL